MTDHVRVSGAEAGAEPHTHGEWLKIEAPGSAPLFVWGCGCCSLEVWTEETLREAMPHRSVQPVVEPEIVRAWERVHG